MSAKQSTKRILVTGAAGKIGCVGPKIVEGLLKQNFNVRAMVRKDDDRAENLRKLGAEVFIGDLTNTQDVVKVIDGITHVYFGMEVSECYLEATTIMASALREQGHIELFVNISQMIVSDMNLSKMTNSKQLKLHWLSEQILNWSGLPVVHIRPTVFMDHPFFTHWASQSIKNSSEIRLPFGNAKTNPIASEDVACVAVNLLTSKEPKKHIGKVYELTGGKTLNLQEMASIYSDTLGKQVKYVNVPCDEWKKNVLEKSGLHDHYQNHIMEMACLLSQNRYDRSTDHVKRLTGRDPMSFQEFIRNRPNFFKT
jgi:uncharacterized protein YbjT (DUF2867 family)